MGKNRCRSLISPWIVATCAVSGVNAQAQQFALEEIVVTAQKRAQSLQDVPVAVSAIAGSKLEESGINRMQDLSAYVPGLTVAQSPLGNQLYIRGIGSTVNQAFEQSVGTFVDGIYYGRGQQSRAPFLDLERVEVLKGPQSILFGKNTIAGAINISSAKPTDEFEAQISAQYEPEQREQEYKVILSGPLGDSIRARLAMRDYSTKGYVTNTLLDRDEPQRDDTTLRGIVAWDVSDDLELIAKAEFSKFDAIGRSLNISHPGSLPFLAGEKLDHQRRVANSQTPAGNFGKPESSSNDLDNFTLTANYQLGEHTVTWISGYSSYDYHEVVDVDFGPLTILETDGQEDFKQLSHELRLTSPLGETVDYIVGLYYQDAELEFGESGNLASSGAAVGLGLPFDVSRYIDFNQNSQTWSAFVQSNWHLTQALTLITGIRYTEEEKEAKQYSVLTDYDKKEAVDDPVLDATAEAVWNSLLNFEHTFDGERKEADTSWLITLQYELNEDTLFYATAVTGFKGGGFDARTVTANSDNFEFEEEKAINIELGMKAALFDGGATLNMAIFRSEFDDLQTSQFDGSTAYLVTNVGKAKSQGVEADLRWRASENLMLSASLTFLDFEFEDFADGNCTSGQTVDYMNNNGLSYSRAAVECRQDLTGRTTQYSPEWSATLSAEYVYPIGSFELITVVDVLYSDEYYIYTDLDPALLEDSYTKINGRIALSPQDGDWEIALIGQNLTDETTSSYGNDVPLSGPSPSFFKFVDPPRSIALSASLRF
jgi:iron complex outermembrane recepter protein